MWLAVLENKVKDQLKPLFWTSGRYADDNTGVCVFGKTSKETGKREGRGRGEEETERLGS